MDTSDDLFAQRLRVMQLLAGALVAAIVMFAGVSVVVVELIGPLGGEADAERVPIVSFVAVVMFAICVPLGLVLPNLLLRNTLQQIAADGWTPPPGSKIDPALFPSDEARLLGVRQAAMLIGLALLQAVGLMGCIAYLNEGRLFALAAAAVVVLLMLWQFPTRDRVHAWLEQHLGLVAELRALGGPSRDEGRDHP